MTTPPQHDSTHVPQIERREFRFSWRPALTVLGVGGALFLLAAALTAQLSWLGLVFVAVVTVPTAAYFANLALRVRLVVDERGVTYLDRGTRKFIGWEHVNGVATSLVSGRRGVREYRVMSLGGEPIVFESELHDAERAYRTIERRLSVELYPQLRETVLMGQVAQFGVATLSRYTVGLRHMTLAVEDAKLARRGTQIALLKRQSGELVMGVDEGEVQNAGLLFRAAAEVDRQLVGK